MFLSSVIAPWIDLAIKAGHLAFEAQAVVGLRLFRMATGTVPLFAETERMIPEKVAALNDAQALVAEGGGSGKTARKVVAGDGSKPTRIGFRRTLVSRGTDGLIINVQSNRRPSGQRPRRGDGHMRVAQAKWARLSGADLSGIRNKQDLIMRVQERYSLPHWQAIQDVELWAEAFAQRFQGRA